MIVLHGSSRISIGALALALTLTACNDGTANRKDAKAAETDAALTGALQDQIVVDPEGMLRAPEPTPAVNSEAKLGELASAQGSRKATKGCDANVEYGADWANRLPAAIPLYPNARVIEAAGNDSGDCRLRVVSFSSAAPMQRLIDWYYTVAIRAGYSSEHQIDEGEHILAGTRETDGGAYYITFASRTGGGTDIDLIANNGR